MGRTDRPTEDGGHTMLFTRLILALALTILPAAVAAPLIIRTAHILGQVQ